MAVQTASRVEKPHWRTRSPRVTTPHDLAVFPHNDLASSPLASELEAAGAFRADVTGAGPTVYGLFEEHATAMRAADAFSDAGESFVVRPIEADDRS